MVVLEKIDCPCCGEDQNIFWASENGFTAVKCSHCNCVYVNPRPSASSIEESVRLGVHQSGNGLLNVVSRFQRQKIKGFYNRLLNLFPNNELRNELKWLDIGAGYGELLCAVKEITSEKSFMQGVEPCEPKRKKAQKLGLNIVESPQTIDNKFNYISLINVCSHLPDPISFLADIKSILSPKGEILLVTGNGGDIPAAEYPEPLYLPDHIVFLAEKNIIDIFDSLSMDVIKLNKYKTYLPTSHINRLTALPKHIVKRASGLPSVYRFREYSGGFRFLWIRARLR